MIVDKLSNLARYKPLNKNLEKAINWIESHDLSKLEYKKYEIDGSEVFLIKMTVDTYDLSTSQYEVHNNYADLHIILDNDEVMFFEYDTLMRRPKTEYVAEGDYTLYELDSKRYKLQPQVGEFILFPPGDAHAPKTAKTIRKMDKIVAKIKM